MLGPVFFYIFLLYLKSCKYSTPDLILQNKINAKHPVNTIILFSMMGRWGMRVLGLKHKLLFHNAGLENVLTIESSLEKLFYFMWGPL